MANYSKSNFYVPTTNDSTSIKIRDIKNNIKYTIYNNSETTFFVSDNRVIIRTDGDLTDIVLDFSTRIEAIQVLSILNVEFAKIKQNISNKKQHDFVEDVTEIVNTIIDDLGDTSLYLPLSGGTMGGVIDMNNNGITQLSSIQNIDTTLSISNTGTSSVGAISLAVNAFSIGAINTTNNVSTLILSNIVDGFKVETRNISGSKNKFEILINGGIKFTDIGGGGAYIRGTNVVDGTVYNLPSKTGAQTFAMLSDLTGGSGNWLADGSYGPATGDWNMGNNSITQPQYIRNFDGTWNKYFDFSGTGTLLIGSQTASGGVYAKSYFSANSQFIKLDVGSEDINKYASIEINPSTGIKLSTSTYAGIFTTNSLTTNRTYTLPNNSGTFALLSDITGGGGSGDWLADGSYGPATGDWNLGGFSIMDVSFVGNSKNNIQFFEDCTYLYAELPDSSKKLGVYVDALASAITWDVENVSLSKNYRVQISDSGFIISTNGNNISSYINNDNVTNSNIKYQLPNKSTDQTFAMLSDIIPTNIIINGSSGTNFTFTTNNIAESGTNFYYTDAKVNANANVINGVIAYSWGNHSTAGYSIDSNIVHKTGNESISGVKNFSDISLGGILIKGNSAINQYIVNSGINSIPDNSPTTVISGGGSPGFPNKIGVVNGLPAGTGLTPTGWAADTTYPGGGASDVATISGGYDNIVNQEAGWIGGGGHNFIKYNSNGHSAIGGGSYNVVAAARSGIFSGYGNSIIGSAKLLSFIGGGSLNDINGSYSNILGGYNHTITADYSTIIGGGDGNVTGSGSVLLKDIGSASFTLTKANSMAMVFSGGVGIGTPSPSDNFHIKANETGAGSSIFRLDNGGTIGNEVGFEFWTSPTDSTSSVRTGRMYGVWDGNSYQSARITLQTMSSSNTLVDTLSLKNSVVSINGNLNVSGQVSLISGTLVSGSNINLNSTTLNLQSNNSSGTGIGISTINNSSYAYLKTTTLTQSETFEFPNKGGTGGTFAMLSDLATKANNRTWTPVAWSNAVNVDLVSGGAFKNITGVTGGQIITYDGGNALANGANTAFQINKPNAGSIAITLPTTSVIFLDIAPNEASLATNIITFTGAAGSKYLFEVREANGSMITLISKIASDSVINSPKVFYCSNAIVAVGSSTLNSDVTLFTIPYTANSWGANTTVRFLATCIGGASTNSKTFKLYDQALGATNGLIYAFNNAAASQVLSREYVMICHSSNSQTITNVGSTSTEVTRAIDLSVNRTLVASCNINNVSEAASAYKGLLIIQYN